MTMLDDDRLASLLADAGARLRRARRRAPRTSWPGPRAAARAPTRPRAATPTTPVRRRPGEAPPGRGARGRVASPALAGRHRLLSCAACIVVLLVVAGTVGALVRIARPPDPAPRPAAAAHAGPRRRRCATTTAPRQQPRGAGHRPARRRRAGVRHRAPGAAPRPDRRRHADRARHCRTVPSASPPRSSSPGPLGLTVGRGTAGSNGQRADRAGRRQRRLRGQLADAVRRGSGAPRGSVTLQVPVDNFAAVLKQAQALGKTSDLTTKATDVTGQYVDLQARIAALRTAASST